MVEVRQAVSQPKDRKPSAKSLRALDALNVFLADVRDGMGPYLSVYLKSSHGWDAAQIGLVLSASTIATVIAQTPAGALVDQLRQKRLLLVIASIAVSIGCLGIVFVPTLPSVLICQVLIGLAAAIFAPAIAAITLGLVGHRRLDRRIGRNETFNHAGNLLAASLAGAIGQFVTAKGIFFSDRPACPGNVLVLRPRNAIGNSSHSPTAMIILRYLVVLLTYVGLGLGYLPGLRMNRATIALVGAAALMSLGVLDLKTAWGAIDDKTLVFLFGMMVISAHLATAGFFQLSLDYLMRYVRSPFGLIVVLTFGSGLLSALFMNDTIALIVTPLIVGLTASLKLNPIPYLLALAGATNTGSVATLSGNPQNILISSFSGISYLEFARALIPLAIVGLCLQIGLLWWLYPEVRSTKPTLKPEPLRYRVFKPLLTKSLLITAGLLVAFLVGIPTAEATLIAAGLLLVTRRIKPDRILQKVDWDLLLMFSGLFILTEGVQKLGSLDWLAQFVHHPLSLLGVTALLSNLVSNVPAVLLLHHLLPHPDTKIWLLLAAGSTLAGNLTLLGSVANLIVAEAVAKQGYRLTFWEHLRFGLPLTIVTLMLTYVWFY